MEKTREPALPSGRTGIAGGIGGAPVAANAAGVAYFLSLFGILFFYSLELQQLRGYSALMVGTLFLPMTVCMALFAPVAGRITSRFGFRPVLTLGLAVAGAGCLLLATEPYGDGLVGLERRLALFGVGCGLTSSTMSNAAVSTVDPAYVSMASAVHNTCRQVGATLGVALLGAIVAGHGFESGLHHAMLLTSVVLFACAVAAAALLKRRQAPSAEPNAEHAIAAQRASAVGSDPVVQAAAAAPKAPVGGDL